MRVMIKRLAAFYISNGFDTMSHEPITIIVTAHRNCVAVSRMKPPIVMARRTRFVGGRNFPQPKQRLDENMLNYQPEIKCS
jgi:hypothetical protein